MKRSILVRTIVIVTATTLLFFAAGFASLTHTPVKALKAEKMENAAAELDWL